MSPGNGHATWNPAGFPHGKPRQADAALVVRCGSLRSCRTAAAPGSTSPAAETENHHPESQISPGITHRQGKSHLTICHQGKSQELLEIQPMQNQTNRIKFVRIKARSTL